MLDIINGAVPVALSERGRALLALIPDHGEAVHWSDSGTDYGSPERAKWDAKCEALDKAINKVVDEILSAPEVHLGDLAVACQHVFLPGASSDQHEALHARLMGVLLGAVGLTPEQCETATWMTVAEERAERRRQG